MPLPFITNPAYTDDNSFNGAIPIVAINRGAHASPTAIIASAILENWTFTNPATVITRPDQIGGPNGFNVIGTQPTASGTIQIPTNTTETPKTGDWFDFTRDGKVGATAETWVIHSIGDVWDYGTYRKITCSAHRAFNPP